MVKIKIEEKAVRKIGIIKKRNEKLYLRIKKQLEVFQQDSRHPSLRLHKLKGNLGKCWSVSAGKNFRMIFEEREDYYYLIGLETHDEVYKGDD